MFPGTWIERTKRQQGIGIRELSWELATGNWQLAKE